MKTSARGFTLIEILLVISIISLLTTIIASMLSGVRVYARDTRRVSDLRAVSVALELYASDHEGTYPSSGGDQHGCTGTGCLAALTDELVSKYISRIPVDPVFANTADGYQYCRANGGNSYQLVTRLETQRNDGWCTVPGTPTVTGTSCWTTNGVPHYPVCKPKPVVKNGTDGALGEPETIEPLPAPILDDGVGPSGNEPKPPAIGTPLGEPMDLEQTPTPILDDGVGPSGKKGTSSHES